MVSTKSGALVLALLAFLGPVRLLAADSDEKKSVEIIVRIVDEQSSVVAGSKVRASGYEFLRNKVSNEKGEIQLSVPEANLRSLTIIADHKTSDRIGIWRADWNAPPTGEEPVDVTLKPSRHLQVVVTNADGTPAAETKVGVEMASTTGLSVVTDAKGQADLRLPTERKLQSLYAVKKGVGFDFRVVSTRRDDAYRADWINVSPVRLQLSESRNIELQMLDDDDKPIADLDMHLWLLYKKGEPDSFNLSTMSPADREFVASTDKQGIARFEGVPTWDVHPLTFWPYNEAYVSDRISFDPAEHPDGRMVVRLSRLVPISGRVVMPDGSPASDVAITVDGASYKSDSFRGETKSEADGTFEILVAPDQLYMITALKEQLAAPAIDGLVTKKGKPINDLEFKLQPGVRVHGQVTVGPDNKPVAKQRMSIRQEGRSINDLPGVKLPNPKNKNYWVQPSIFRSTYTDENGNYEFFVAAGSYRLSGPSQVKGKSFEIQPDSEEKSLEFDFAAARPEEGPFNVKVVTGEAAEPVENATVTGKYRAMTGHLDMRLRTDDSGRASGIRQLHRTVLYAKSEDGKLAGMMEIDADQASTTMVIAPVASATGIAIDEPTGEPIRNTKITWGRTVHLGDDDAPWETAWGGSHVTDENGTFELHGLVPGQEYTVSLPRGDGSYSRIAKVNATNADSLDLGECKVERPYKAPTFEERIDRALTSERTPLERFERAIKEAQRLKQHILVVFVDRESPLTRSWFKVRYEDRPVRNELPNYQLLQVDVKDDVEPLLSKLDLELEKETLPAWQFFDADGKALSANQTIPQSDATEVEVAEGEASAIDQPVVMELLGRYAPEPLDARQLVIDAYAEAKRSNRRIFIQETATWCGPCHILARFLEKHRERWEQDYIWIKIDQRWKGADEVMDSIKEGYRGGIPWCAILSADGELLATSDGPDGDNIGFPSEPKSIDHFMSMLETTQQRMTEDDLQAIREALENR